MGRLLKGLVLAALLATTTQPVLAQSAPSYLTNPAKAATWGSITGTLSSQTDLNTALGLKVDTSTYTSGLALKAPVSTAPVILCQSGAQVAVTGTAVETQVYSCAIPAMSANGRIALKMEGTFTGATAARTINIYFGGSVILTHAPSSSSVIYVDNADITNRNATNSQRGKSVILTASNGISAASGSGAVDTTSPTTLAVKLQLNASDSGTLDSISVIYYPA